MNLTAEEKRKIVARFFFRDNPDEYEDFHEAHVEFASGQNVSDSFVDSVIEMNIKSEEGHSFVMNESGHVAKVRLTDGFFEPLTGMTEEEGSEVIETFHAAEGKYDLDGLDLLLKCGWKVIA